MGNKSTDDQLLEGRYIDGPIWNHDGKDADRYVKTISLPSQQILVDLYVRQEEHADFFVMRHNGQKAESFFIATFNSLLAFLMFDYPSLLSQKRWTARDALRAVIYRHVLRLLMNSGCFDAVCRRMTSIHVLSQPLPHFDSQRAETKLNESFDSSPTAEGQPEQTAAEFEMKHLTQEAKDRLTAITGHAGVARCQTCGTYNPWLSPVPHCTPEATTAIAVGISFTIETTKGCRRCGAKNPQLIVRIETSYEEAERIANNTNLLDLTLAAFKKEEQSDG